MVDARPLAADPAACDRAARRPGAELRQRQRRHPDRPLHLRRLEPDLGLGSNAHWTLPNVTLTDLFCSAQIVLPQSGNVALFGGDIWNGATTTNVGNNNSDVFNPATNILSRGANMHSPRWYATVTTLPSGETYVQGGRGGPGLVGGELRPEIRDLAGNFRVLNGADTSGLYW